MKKTPVRVNADYESVLFTGNPISKINEAMEFLALYLEDAPLYSLKTYPENFLNYVEEVSGIRPSFVNAGPSENWWGELKDLELEKWQNSKLTSTKLSLSNSWLHDTYILESTADVESLPEMEFPLLAKNPHEMSGRGFKFYQHGIGEKEKAELSLMVARAPLILEPWLQRKFDFSHWVFPDGKTISYETIVDSRFQYKGTIFNNWREASVENLSFYQSISPERWSEFQSRLQQIKDFYSVKKPFQELKFGFSVDSLVHELDSELSIHPLCEVNFRRTMGRVAYDLSRKYAQEFSWTAFLLLPETAGSFDKTLPLRSEKRLIHLSPEGGRFCMVFLMAKDKSEASNLMEELKDLLALSELPVKIE